MRLALPPGYRSKEIQAFHARDALQLCEQIQPDVWIKRLVIKGQPCQLELRFLANEVVINGCQGPEVLLAAQRMLGLQLDPTAFEQTFAQDEILAPLLAARPGLRLAQLPTVYETLTWAIMGQQINLKLALQLRRTFIQLAGVYCRGQLCYPDALNASNIDWPALLQHKFTRAKAETLQRVTELVISGQLDLEQCNSESLLAIKGIGPWTVNYTRMRGLGLADCSLHGDVVVQKALSQILGRSLRTAEVQSILSRYEPYRSLVAIHCWAAVSKQA